ncbi:MAG: EthD family reductase [Gammaproteobacteria bacterium]|nr:EthD family reductase [Gammaproteobacteria bacterium]MBU1441763.1 EthD family reductase [Gammaproteobacteria bacterium]MBU2286019.1 EthD family reductase [Gammaproteobacteria bacterium]MBU2410495.1 EthD family reductase [Gammaproteobacteria bacterium]
MKLRMGLIRKKANWSLEQFDSYWQHQHGPLAARAPKLREYWQNRVTDRLQRGIDFARGPWDFDGFSQLWLGDSEQADSAFADGEFAAALVADEAHFLGDLHIVTAQQDVVIPLPEKSERERLFKRMSILKRLPGTTEDDFRREWKTHGDLVRQMPGVSAYRQHVVLARERLKGHPCSYAELPMDGIVELWFKDTETLEAAFYSPNGRNTMAHAKTFLVEITAFHVDERRIV